MIKIIPPSRRLFAGFRSHAQATRMETAMLVLFPPPIIAAAISRQARCRNRERQIRNRE